MMSWTNSILYQISMSKENTYLTIFSSIGPYIKKYAITWPANFESPKLNTRLNYDHCLFSITPDQEASQLTTHQQQILTQLLLLAAHTWTVFILRELFGRGKNRKYGHQKMQNMKEKEQKNETKQEEKTTFKKKKYIFQEEKRKKIYNISCSCSLLFVFMQVSSNPYQRSIYQDCYNSKYKPDFFFYRHSKSWTQDFGINEGYPIMPTGIRIFVCRNASL